MKLENLDDNIKKLFFSLIYETPAVITNHRSLIYNVVENWLRYGGQ